MSEDGHGTYEKIIIHMKIKIIPKTPSNPTILCGSIWFLLTIVSSNTNIAAWITRLINTITIPAMVPPTPTLPAPVPEVTTEATPTKKIR